MKKQIALWILASLLLSGCGTETQEQTESAAADTEEIAGQAEQITPAVKFDLASADYGQADICILSGEHAEYEYMIEEETGEVMNDAIYIRNRNTEELLNVKFNFVSAPNWTSDGMFYTMIRTDVTAGDNSYGIVNGLNCWTNPLIFEGMFRRLDNISTINLENPWWVPGLSLDGSDNVYFAFSDASLSLYKDLYVIFFNQTILEQNGAVNPYDLVENGTWTIDAFLSLANEGSMDLNGDGTITLKDDRIAYVAKHAANRAFLTSTDTSIFRANDDGTPKLEGISTRLADAYDKLRPFFSDGTKTYLDTEPDMILLSNPFIEGRVLFLTNCLGAVEGMRDMADDYGIVPLPKYDESQSAYRSQLATSTSALYMEATASETEMLGQVMETLGYFSYKDVVPVYYETALNAKYARDEQVQNVLAIVRENASTNIDFTYNTIFWTNDVFNLAQMDMDLASWYASMASSLRTTLDQYLEIELNN
ncbi:MAG: hypothetical protein IJF78_10640 [Clostridia bacterium]|nr:hypothetical protein [Clostridia bacterium]